MSDNDKRKIDLIINIVLGVYNLELDQISTRSRKYEVKIARNMIFLFLRIYTDLGYKEIGEVFHRDHATAMHAVNTIVDAYQVNRAFYNELKKIYDRIIFFGFKPIKKFNGYNTYKLNEFIDDFIEFNGMPEYPEFSKDKKVYISRLEKHIQILECLYLQQYCSCETKEIKYQTFQLCPNCGKLL